MKKNPTRNNSKAALIHDIESIHSYLQLLTHSDDWVAENKEYLILVNEYLAQLKHNLRLCKEPIV